MTSRLILILLGSILLTGCGKKEAITTSNSTSAAISKWKTKNSSSSTSPMGLVLEQKGQEIKATLSELQGTNGFMVGARLAVGNYQPDQKAIILMMGNLSPSLMPPEQWIANGGPYMKIPYEQGATNLAMTTVVKGGPSVTVNLLPYNGE